MGQSDSTQRFRMAAGCPRCTPPAGHPRHAPLREALQQLSDAHAVHGSVALEYQTRAFIGTLN